MGERKSYEYLNKLKNKLNTETLWSWSRYNSYLNDPYGYLLKYIKHEKETKKDSIWGVSGNICHSILEDYYSGKLKYEDMLTEYEDKLFEMDAMELKYNRSNQEQNEKTADKYEESVKHFFINYKPIEGKVILEQFVTVKVGEHYFQGYLDFVHRDSEGNYIIEDFKTSTIYTGSKKEKEAGQLILYSEALMQKGVPIDKIKIRWNFLKYCTVTSDLFGKNKDGSYKTKSKNCVRKTWVKDSESNISKWLKKEGYDELEIEDMIQTCIENNSLDTLPNEISDRFSISDCYVYIDLTEEIVEELNNKIIETLDEIIDKTKSAKEILKEIESLDKINDIQQIKTLNNELDEMFWTEIDKSKEYFFYNLSGYNRKQHIPWDMYLKETEMFVKTSDLVEENDNSLDWLNDL
jgi:hypothetical protein